MDNPHHTSESVLIFFHIPKAGGTTLSQIIDRYFLHDEVYRIYNKDDTKNFLTLSEPERTKIRCLKGHMRFGLYEYFSSPSHHITILRHPVERLISYYYYIRENPNHRLYDIITSDKMSLEAFVTSDKKAIYTSHNAQTRRLAGARVTESSGPFLSPKALDMAKKNLKTHFKVVGILDKFDETLLILRKAFGWENIYYLKKNVTQNRPSLTAIDEKLIPVIEQKNQLDMALYEFAGEMLEASIGEYGSSFKRDLRSFQIKNHLKTDLIRIKRLLARFRN